MPDASEVCPECGAPAVTGLACWEQLGALLAWEGADPELRAEHFLTVACYNLQHPAQFTDEALAWLRSGFVERVDHGAAVEDLRRRAAHQFAGPVRVLRLASERRPVSREWSRTIADVYTPESPRAAARVRAWAAAIRRDLDGPPGRPAPPDGAAEVRWAPRVPQHQIRRLYETDASGPVDEARQRAIWER